MVASDVRGSLVGAFVVRHAEIGALRGCVDFETTGRTCSDWRANRHLGGIVASLAELKVPLTLFVAGVDHNASPYTHNNVRSVRRAGCIASRGLLALGTVAQTIYAIACTWAWVSFVAVVLTFHTLLGGDIAHLESMRGGRGWRGFVARGVAVLQGVALTFARLHARPSGAIAYVTLLTLVGGVHSLAMPIIFTLILTTRSNGAIVVDRGFRRTPATECVVIYTLDTCHLVPAWRIRRVSGDYSESKKNGPHRW